MVTICKHAVGSRELFKLQLAQTTGGAKQVRQICRLVIRESASSAGTKLIIFF